MDVSDVNLGSGLWARTANVSALKSVDKQKIIRNLKKILKRIDFGGLMMLPDYMITIFETASEL